MSGNNDQVRLLGLRSAVYRAPDLQAAKAWYTSAFGIQPNIDQPFFVGFNIGGFELGLDPDATEVPGGKEGAIAYWGVEDAAVALDCLVRLGATKRTGVLEFLGGSVKLATVFDPFGNILGMIETRP
jgi:predicted enzyme related to lactoylglutathione lyase